MSSRSFSMIVCRRRAPMFSVFSFTAAAKRATSWTASSLNALAAHIWAVPAFASGNFIDFVQEDNAAVLDALDSQAGHGIHIDELLLLFLNQVFQRFGDLHLSFLGALSQKTGKDIFDVDIHFLDTLIADDLECRKVALLDLDFDHALVEFAFPQLSAQFLPRPVPLFGRRPVAVVGCPAGQRHRWKQ